MQRSATVTTFLEEVAGRIDRLLGPQLAGLYAIGSLARGDGVAATSDVDLLAVAATVVPPPLRERLAHDLVTTASRCPLRGLELVLYAAGELETPRHPLSYLLNVNAGPSMPTRVSTGGDPAHWFLLDVAMARSGALRLRGPEVSRLVGRTDPADARAAILDSRRWHEANEDATVDGVLNACRGWRFAAEGLWSSKSEAAAWAAARSREHGQVVGRALALRSEGRTDEHLDRAAVAALVAHVHDEVGSAPARPGRPRR